MGSEYLDIRKLTYDIGMGIFSTIIVSILAANLLTIVIPQRWLVYIIIVLILVMPWSYYLWKRHKRTIRFIQAGKAGYYYSFDLKENTVIWQRAGKSWCYLGISGDSILEALKEWLEEKDLLSSYRILLMKPGSPALFRQEAFERGIGLEKMREEIPKEALDDIERAVVASSERIKSAAAVLKNSQAFRKGRLQIGLYDEFTPWWMYVIDDSTVYVGILECGKRGNRSPVEFRIKDERYVGPVDAFKNHFDRIWEGAEKVA